MRSSPLLLSLSLATCMLSAACATSRESTSPQAEPTVQAEQTTTVPTPVSAGDPRVGLGAGWMDAAEAAWNLRLISETPPSDPFIPAEPGAFQFINSDLAFFGDHVVQGNFYGWQVWDVSNPAAPTLATSHICPGWQNDVSVYGNLLFTSVEDLSGRIDCGPQGVPEPVSPDRMRGIRIFDISDLANPRNVANVQTCRGSHTHTLVTDPDDLENVYIYVSGSAPVRSSDELAGCSDAPPDEDPESALLRIEVIQIPLAAPEQARIVSSPRIFSDLEAPPTHPEPEDSAAAGDVLGPGPDQCHDITVYPAIDRAGGACEGYGFLLDISDVANPTRVDAVADPNFAYWHSATFNNDGSKVLFTDEWGGGLAARCRESDRYEWGANAIFTIAGDSMTFASYYKLPAPQTENENCVAHNGSLVPVPGRDIMVQAWYQGGISVFDWTDADNPMEIAYFDRGPMDASQPLAGGSWSAYWYNGYIYSSEISRGLDVLELTPSEFLTQNEIDAAKLVQFDVLNVQEQQKLVWPPSFVVAHAYLDQLERSDGLLPDQIATVRSALERSEELTGQAQSDALNALVTQLDGYSEGAADVEKTRALAAAVRELTNGQS
jgi:hypothetical protein